MNTAKTTSELAVLATAMVAALGIDPVDIKQYNDDDDVGVVVQPPMKAQHDCWYLHAVGTDNDVDDRPGIDVVVIRAAQAKSDMAYTIESQQQLMSVLHDVHHMSEDAQLHLYAVRRYSDGQRGVRRLDGISFLEAVSRKAARAAAKVLWPSTASFKVNRAENALG